MDPRPLPPVALRLTGNICPTCDYPVGIITWERYSLQVLFCPVCENGWTREKSLPAVVRDHIEKAQASR